MISELGVSLSSFITLSTPSFCPRSATTQRISRPSLPEDKSSCSSRSLSSDLATRTSTEPGFRRADISLARHLPKPLDAPVMMQRALPRSFVSDEATFEVLLASMSPFSNEIKISTRSHLIILDARLVHFRDLDQWASDCPPRPLEQQIKRQTLLQWIKENKIILHFNRSLNLLLSSVTCYNRIRFSMNMRLVHLLELILLSIYNTIIY